MTGAQPPGGRRGGRLVLLAVGAAGVAVLLALVSIVIALRAGDRAQHAQDRADAVLAGAVGRSQGGGGNAQQTSSPTTAATATQSTDGSAPTDAASTVGPVGPPTDPAANYTKAYDKQNLDLQAACSATVYIDLDEPRVGVSSAKNDLMLYRNCSDQAAIFQLPADVVGSTSDSPGLTPQDCADKNRKSPIGENLGVPAKKGVVMCIATSLGKAREQGLKQKVALLEVNAEGKDGKVSVTVTAWNVPN
jgi:hypothetical protein